MGVLLAVAYVFGGFATANLFLANHEISHNLVRPGRNPLTGAWAKAGCLVIHAGVSFSCSWRTMLAVGCH